MAEDILRGLRSSPRQLPCRLLWDARGAELFARICELDDYYLTRHELALLRAHLPAIATAVGPRARVIEPGSGVGIKTRMLLDALVEAAGYVTIEVSAEQLATTAAVLRADYPALDVDPVCGDYMQAVALPPPRRPYARSLVFFPGSTIGNFELDEARTFLGRFGDAAGAGAWLVLGADSNDDESTLVRAYDDREGVTAEFDRNVLAHLARAYDGELDAAAFRHRAVWDPARRRIEMHLVSTRDQRVRVAGETFALAAGEPIVTEHCYKYAPATIAALLADAGWQVREVFVDPRGWMRLWLASRA